MYQIDEIIAFVEKHTGASEVLENSDIVEDLGCDGDDFADLMDRFSKDFHVDISSYYWYFHHAEEGSWNSVGGSFFRPPDQRVKRIPVTPKMLLGFAKSGKWEIQYPDHKVPGRRYDIVINQVLIVIFIVVLIYKCTSR
jgi:hypothetical protein